jgi:uncharacterized membrane protein YfcA
MIEHGILFYAAAIPAVIFAGISKGGFGSGAAFAATPLLALVMPPGAAIGLMLPLLMLMDVSALRPYWRLWSARDAWRMTLGAAPGVVLATVFYAHASADLLRLLIGLMALGFVAFQLARAGGWLVPRARPYGAAAGLLAGVVAGFASFISHAGGPPAAIYLLSQRLDKTAYQATSVLIFWAVNLMKAPPYALTGIFTRQTLEADVLLAPFALLGVWLGVKAHRAMPERPFFAVTYTLLTMTGLKLVLDVLF